MKNNVYPCKPQFYYIKVGFKGVKIIQACFRDGCCMGLCSGNLIRLLKKLLCSYMYTVYNTIYIVWMGSIDY